MMRRDSAVDLGGERDQRFADLHLVNALRLELLQRLRQARQFGRPARANVVEGGDGDAALADLGGGACGVSLDQPLREAREAFERMYFEHHLRLEGGNMTRLAEKTGLERTHLYRKLKQLGLQAGRRHEES